jgi:hypothetical protein
MKTNAGAKKGLYIGAGAGLTVFAIAGLLYGSFIGGVIGLNIAGSIFGLPLTASLLPRLVVGASMVLGIIVSGALSVASCSVLGWLAGHMVDAAGQGRTLAVTAKGK